MDENTITDDAAANIEEAERRARRIEKARELRRDFTVCMADAAHYFALGERDRAYDILSDAADVARKAIDYVQFDCQAHEMGEMCAAANVFQAMALRGAARKSAEYGLTDAAQILCSRAIDAARDAYLTAFPGADL